MKNTFAQAMLAATLLGTITLVTACGGGGGGGGGGGYSGGGGGGSTIYYPYETLYGDLCTSSTEPTPGCTFLRNTDNRVQVKADPNYNRYGNGSDDMKYVKFYRDYNGSVYGKVYSSSGYFLEEKNITAFAGYVPGSNDTIGLGTTGFYWENVVNGQYWIGKNDVLYNANYGETNYGEAINEDSASAATDTNFAALSSEANKAIVKKASKKLQADYGFTAEKATAVASALNKWGVSAADRGYVTEAYMDKTFKSVFGVDYKASLAAIKDLQAGDSSAMTALTNKSASALGLKPHQAKKFMKGMYRDSLASNGYDVDSLEW